MTKAQLIEGKKDSLIPTTALPKTVGEHLVTKQLFSQPNFAAKKQRRATHFFWLKESQARRINFATKRNSRATNDEGFGKR